MEQVQEDHIIMFPFMAQGHLIPFLALALHMEQRTSYKITIVNTPLNIKKLHSSLPPNSSINLVDLPFCSTDENQTPLSYVSIYSNTPGKLTKEVEHIKEEGFTCGKEKVVDFVTFTVDYGCWSSDDTGSGWDESEIPTLLVEQDVKKDERLTRVSIDTKASKRWALAINTNEIEDFKFEANSEELVSVGGKTGVDGWHIIQYSGGKNAPTKFGITLFWAKNSTWSTDGKTEDKHLLLKLRTDVNRLTAKAERVLQKLPSWCSMFGKSTSPFTLAYLSSLPVNF